MNDKIDIKVNTDEFIAVLESIIDRKIKPLEEKITALEEQLNKPEQCIIIENIRPKNLKAFLDSLKKNQ